MRPKAFRLSPVYAHAHNVVLALLRAEVSVGEKLPAQAVMAERCGASQTTVHHVLRLLRKSGLIGGGKATPLLLRLPLRKDFLPEPRMLSRREKVEHDLMKRLLDGRLRPGERFSELALARAHDVTTGTIREALLRLAGLGVFIKSKRKQWQVAEINLEMLDDLMDLRVLLESFALNRYFQGPVRRSEPFIRLLSEMQKLVRTTHLARDEFFRLDRELHRAILEAGRNRYLADHFHFISFPIQIQFLHKDFTRKGLVLGLRQHLGILKAIVAGDRKRALALLGEHLRTARETLRQF